MLQWIDNRTVLGADLVMAALFTVAFVSMRNYAPRLRATRDVAASYGSVTVACALFVARGSIPALLSIVLANALVYLSMIFFLLGIQRFFGYRRQGPLLIALLSSAISTGLVATFTFAHNSLAARVVVVGITSCLLRSLIAAELLRSSRPGTVARAFGNVMLSYAGLSLMRTIGILAVHAPNELMQHNLVVTGMLVGDACFIFILGLFALFMLASELLSITKDESLQDPLTGALNRRGIDDLLAQELKRAERSGNPLSVAFIDIDRFKSINDQHGHAGGDAALRQVSAAIASRLRAYDRLARYGGDEFLLVLPQTNWKHCQLVCNRLERIIHGITIGSTAVSISCGITQAVAGDSTVTLLRRADKALYKAKREGRDQSRVVLHDPELQSQDAVPVAAPTPLPQAAARTDASSAAAVPYLTSTP
ncbi:MAG: GGDEF domain-containing protein [Acidobacteriota bacterium]|nr:GGDEF domain-containing protein [Acidobacteriota bacterium]